MEMQLESEKKTKPKRNKQEESIYFFHLYPVLKLEIQMFIYAGMKNLC